MFRIRHCLAASLFCCFLPALAGAQARFDLAGPKVDVRVTRNGVTLPIAAVPNLQPGDQLWLHPALPPTQSVKYLLIAAFLRGTTNPPPENWFTRVETWNKKVREEGVTITVPAEAQQAILFLAPETGGDFSTLRSAVQGRPGVFVRASQDLTEAGFEQGRIDKYLASMKLVPPSDPAALVEHSNLLARTLNLKPNLDCFKRPLDQQYNCLTQTGTQTLLDDGHGQSVVAALSTGSGSDFINAASNTRLAGGGEYSAYVGAIVDFVRILNSVHTAQYQYIPGLALPAGDALDLRLNTPPSFHNPKSVIVIGLPAIQKAVPPPLRPADPRHVSCLADPQLVLPVDGAPLVFTTAFAHDLTLRLDHSGTELPLTPDAFQGGLTVSASAPVRKELPLEAVNALGAAGKAASEPKPATPPMEKPGETIRGTVTGFWGFDPFTGPTLLLQRGPGTGWHIVDTGEQHLIAGQPNHLSLLSSGTACVRSIAMQPGTSRLEWKTAPPSGESLEEPRPVEVTLNLQKAATPGSIQLEINQFGSDAPDHLGTRTFSEPAQITSLQLHAGDLRATLQGTSLGQVKSLALRDLSYTPAQPSESGGKSLLLTLPAEAKTPTWKPGERVTGQVQLEDGRNLPVQAFVQPARPAVTLLSRKISGGPATAIKLASPSDLPLGSTMEFFLKSKTVFSRTETLEIAQVPGPEIEEPLHTTLSVAAGTLVLQDAHTVLATFDPLKTFGASTFGAFRMRAIAADGTEGEWTPLTTIVRLPTLTEVVCPADPALSCNLTGSGLYLISAVSMNLGFSPETDVPEGFVEPALAIPRPEPGGFYLKLKDDPATTQAVALPVITGSGKQTGVALSPKQ